jgi:diacylglycerol kinase family enzyme
MLSDEDPSARTLGRTERRRILCVNASAGSRNVGIPDGLLDFERFDLQAALNVLATLIENDEAHDLLVAVWGGDGTIRSVAALLAGSPATLLACPGGTHNHFCRTLGLNNHDDVEHVLATGEVAYVDVGTVGPAIFLNNLSIGWYTDLVSRRERYEKSMPRRLAKIISSAVQLVRTRRLRLTVDGAPERLWLAWVGNGEYSFGPARLTERANMSQGVLDLRLLRAGGHWPKFRAAVDVVRGDAESSPRIVRNLLDATTLTGRRAHIRVALDGELALLENPIRVSIMRRSLRVLVPEGQSQTDG